MLSLGPFFSKDGALSSAPLPWVYYPNFRRENVREREEMEKRNQKNFGDNLGGGCSDFWMKLRAAWANFSSPIFLAAMG